MRGVVMVLMALDHVREFLTNVPGNPLDPNQTTVELYATRWITHLCAPVFVALAGTSIFFQQQRKASADVTRRLVARGLWLIVAELTVIHLAFTFNWKWNVQFLEVIWAIGASMMLMALIIHVGVRWSALVGTVLIAGHNAFDGVTPAGSGPSVWLWRLLHVPGPLTGPPLEPPIIIVAYPLLPWLGVMAVGYAFGRVMLRAPEERMRLQLRAGVAMLAAFVVMRSTNVYGDPFPWTLQDTWWRTLLSFLNVQKYPPSLLFLLATLGTALLIMTAFERLDARGMFQKACRVLETYGRVPFFYFVAHLVVIHLLVVLVSAATGADWRWWVTEFPNGGVLTGRPPGWGCGLPTIWAVWIVVVALCYPACTWYAGIKSRSRNPLLSYL
jgi:uncharacterized membrane protein